MIPAPSTFDEWILREIREPGDVAWSGTAAGLAADTYDKALSRGYAREWALQMPVRTPRSLYRNRVRRALIRLAKAGWLTRHPGLHGRNKTMTYDYLPKKKGRTR